jgi:hypothetical protein
MAALIVARGLGYRVECITCGCVLPGVCFSRSDAAHRHLIHDRMWHT